MPLVAPLCDGLTERHAIYLGDNNRPIEIGLTFPTTEVAFSALVLRLFTQREVVWKTPTVPGRRIRAWTIGRGERRCATAASRKFRAAAMIARIGAISRFAQCQRKPRDVIAIIFSRCTTCRYSSNRVLIPRITVGSAKCLRAYYRIPLVSLTVRGTRRKFRKSIELFA